MKKAYGSTLARWFFAVPLTLFGCWIYIASPLIGGGVHLDPQPGLGVLFAAGAIVVAMGGYWLIRWEKNARILATIINIALIWGTISLVFGLLRGAYETMYQVQVTEWGHSRPGAVLFQISYGALSLAVLTVFNLRIRKRDVTNPS